MPRKNKLTEKCINPRCKNNQHSRGLCNACIFHAYELIKSGKYTEEQLVADGKIWPAHSKANQKRAWFKEQV